MSLITPTRHRLLLAWVLTVNYAKSTHGCASSADILVILLTGISINGNTFEKLNSSKHFYEYTKVYTDIIHHPNIEKITIELQQPFKSLNIDYRLHHTCYTQPFIITMVICLVQRETFYANALWTQYGMFSDNWLVLAINKSSQLYFSVVRVTSDGFPNLTAL